MIAIMLQNKGFVSSALKLLDMNSINKGRLNNKFSSLFVSAQSNPNSPFSFDRLPFHTCEAGQPFSFLPPLRSLCS